MSKKQMANEVYEAMKHLNSLVATCERKGLRVDIEMGYSEMTYEDGTPAPHDRLIVNVYEKL